MKGQVSRWLHWSPAVQGNMAETLEFNQGHIKVLLVTFDFFSADLTKPDEGVRQGALHHRGEAHIVSDHHLIHGLDLEPAAVAFAVSFLNTLKIPALQRYHRM